MLFQTCLMYLVGFQWADWLTQKNDQSLLNTTLSKKDSILKYNADKIELKLIFAALICRLSISTTSKSDLIKSIKCTCILSNVMKPRGAFRQIGWFHGIAQRWFFCQIDQPLQFVVSINGEFAVTNPLDILRKKIGKSYVSFQDQPTQFECGLNKPLMPHLDYMSVSPSLSRLLIGKTLRFFCRQQFTLIQREPSTV